MLLKKYFGAEIIQKIVINPDLFIFRYSRLDHPRFGLICTTTALRDIDAGEEILVNYGWSMSDAPLWYKHLWVDHVRRNEGWDDERILRWCALKYNMNGTLVQLPL